MPLFTIKVEGSIDVNHRVVGMTLTSAQFTELKQILVNNQGILMDIATKLAASAAREEQMADDVRAALDELTQQVSGLESQEDSLITYVQGLSAQLQQNAGNAQAIRDIAAKLQSDARRMSDAVLTSPSDGGSGGTAPAGGGETAPAGGGGSAPAGGGSAPTPPDGGGTAPSGGTGETSPGGVPGTTGEEPPMARRR